MLPDPAIMLAVYEFIMSQCTYRCVVLPDSCLCYDSVLRLQSQCTYRCVVLPDVINHPYHPASGGSLNAPTGAWCSLTAPDQEHTQSDGEVSMHLQVRGAP